MRCVVFQLKCKVAQCVFKGTKERGETMAKGAMNKNLSKPIKLSTRGGKRFRCYKKIMQPDNKN